MAQYDGSIRILTKISTEMAEKSLGTLSQTIKGTANEISSLRSKMDAMKGQKFYTDDYKKLQSDLAQAEKKLADFKSLSQSSAVKNKNAQKAVNEQIKNYEEEIESIKGKMQTLEDSGKGFTLGSDTAEYANYERQLEYEQAALAEATKQYQALEKLNDPYGRLSQSISDLNSKLSAILRPIQAMKVAFSQDVNISGYDRLHNSLVELISTTIRASDSVKTAFSILRDDPLSAVHAMAGGLLNLASNINSTVLGSLNAVGEKIGYAWGKIKDTAFKTVDSIKEKLAGFAGIVLNSVLHPIQTIKNVANPIIEGFGNIFKFAIEKAKASAAGFAASIINGILHPIQTLKSASNNLENVIKKFGGVARNVFSSINGLAKKLDNGLKKLTKTIIGLFTHSKKAANSNNNILKTGFKNILKYGLGIRSLYVLVNKIRAGIKEGFSNFAEYSNSFKSSIDGLKGSMLTLKNAFAAAFSPLVEMAIPYIQRVIDYLVKLMDIVGQVMAALTGQKNYTRAIKQTTGAIKEQNKAQNKQLSGLDKLNNLTSSSSGGSDGGGAADMFEEAPIEDRWKEMAEKLKKIGKDLFRPIKEAWDKEGKFVMDSWKYAFDEVKKLLKDIGRDFMTVWNQPETIAMFEDIFHIVGDIGLVVGNLARNFRAAWNENQVGLHIFENIRDILAAIIHNIRLAADYTVEWSDKLDFYPILSKIEEWTKSLIPVFDALSGMVMDFYTMVLLPLAQWTLEKGLPDLLQVFIDFNNKVDWAILRANLAEFWQHLEPFAETVGEGLIIFISRISDALANFVNSDAFVLFLSSIGEWMDNVKPEDVANALEKLAIALISIKVAVMGFSAISAVLPVFKSLASVLGLFGPAGIAVGALALAAFLSKTIEDVDMGKVGQAVGNAVIKLVDFIGKALREINWLMLGQKVIDFIAGIDWISLFTSLVEALAGILGNVIGGGAALVAVLAEAIGNLIPNAFEAAKEYFDEKTQEMGGNAILGFLKGIIDGIAGIGNWIIEHIFTPFIEGFKNAFGIHSPSTVMAEMGTYIIQGLLDGITSLVDKVKETWESMKETALEVWENVKTGLTEKWEKAKEKASKIWGDVKDDCSDTWNLIKKIASKKWDDISGTIKGTIDTIKGWIDDLLVSFKKVESKQAGMTSGGLGGALGGAFGKNNYSYGLPPAMAATLSNMEFPGYATGQVIPVGMKKHLAWLGDNTRETEVVSPLSTIKQADKEAVLEVLSELGLFGNTGRSSNGDTYVFQVDGKTFFEITRNEAQRYFKRTGMSPYPI